MPHATAQSSGGPGLRHLFSAPMATWHMGLSLPRETMRASSAGDDAVDAALALSRVEPWIAVIEDWLGFGLMPAPIEGSGRSELLAFDRHLCLEHRESSARMHLPWGAVVGSRPPPSELAQWRWHPLRCKVLLDAVVLSDADRDVLHPGALVLLASSFTPSWMGRVQPHIGESELFTAQLQPLPDAMAVRTNPIRVAAYQAGSTVASLAQFINLAPHHLLGWQPEGEAATSALVTVASNAVNLHGAWPADGERIAAGRLMSTGSGMGVHLSRVYQAVPLPVAA